MARRRFQRGQLVREADRWVGRWREDVEMPDGTVRRARRAKSRAGYETLSYIAQSLKCFPPRQARHRPKLPVNPAATLCVAQVL